MVVGIVVIGAVLVEAFRLVELKLSVGRYAHYWASQPADGNFTYVAIGDSAAQGIGASQPQLGYVGLLAGQIQQATGQKVRVVNLSVSGAKIEDVITRQLPLLGKYHPDILTVEIGSNDVAQNNMDGFASRFEDLAKALPAGSVVANIPYFGGRIQNNAQAIQANIAISASASAHHLKLVDLQYYTKKHQSIFNYAADYFHPNNRGYRNWDAAFWQVIRPLVSKQTNP